MKTTEDFKAMLNAESYSNIKWTGDMQANAEEVPEPPWLGARIAAESALGYCC